PEVAVDAARTLREIGLLRVQDTENCQAVVEVRKKSVRAYAVKAKILDWQPANSYGAYGAYGPPETAPQHNKKGLYGWSGALSAEQTERIARTKDIIYDGFKFALGAGLAKDRAGLLVDEQFGSRILRDALANGFIAALPAEKSGQA